MRKFVLLAAAAALAATAFASPALAKSARKKQQEMTAEIPICHQRLGTIAVVEPDTNWWSGLGLSSPEAIIKLFVMRSGCFGLVDRNKGLQSRNIERALADNGELQEGSNIGRGQVKAADYFLVPDIISQNRNAGGTNLGGLAGGLLGNSTFGAIAGGVSINKKEANVLLTLVNARTTEQERMTEGYYKKTDVGFALGGGAGWWSGFGALGASSYQNTEIGQVIVLAYLKAYRDMVYQLGGLPTNPSAAAPQAR
jgi:curli biogenesis system outer membrane secretion channel CsgG